jgi:hypothetical protein
MSKDTGGPAFPLFAATGHSGMTLRDYFATKAMQGFIDYAAAKGHLLPSDDQLAKCAYDMADAMLKERDQ